MNKYDYDDFILTIFEKTKLTGLIASIFIALFELMFSIRMLFTQGFMDSTHYGYFLNYLSLFTITIFGIILLYSPLRKKVSKKFPYYFLHFYFIAISLWSIAISLLDVSRGSYPIVFITVMFCIPIFITINPIYGAFLTIAGSIGILYIQHSSFPLTSSGFYLNFLVFIAMAIIVNFNIYFYKLRNYQLEAELRDKSMRDNLTGLFNRRAMDIKLIDISENSKNTIIMLDYDDFKSINDICGHDAGDDCLCFLADLLIKYFGENIFRYGGDEFIIISDKTPERIIEAIKSINYDLNRRFSNKYPNIETHVSAGITRFDSNSSVPEILKKADEALYNAKNTAKGTAVLYNK